MSELLDKLPRHGDPLIKIDATVCYLGLGAAYEKLKSLQNDLSKLIDTKLEFVMTEMSKEEKEEWEKNREKNLEKLLKQYPEISENLV